MDCLKEAIGGGRVVKELIPLAVCGGCILVLIGSS